MFVKFFHKVQKLGWVGFSWKKSQVPRTDQRNADYSDGKNVVLRGGGLQNKKAAGS